LWFVITTFRFSITEYRTNTSTNWSCCCLLIDICCKKTNIIFLFEKSIMWIYKKFFFLESMNHIQEYLLSISVNFCRDLSGDVSIINFEFCCWTRLEFDADCWIARGGGVVAKIKRSYVTIFIYTIITCSTCCWY
jgi:hypothetical protein